MAMARSLKPRWIVAALLGAVTACGGEPPEESPRPLEISGTPFVVRDTQVVDGFPATGIAEPVQRALLASRLMARVTELAVQEGEQAKVGRQFAVNLFDARESNIRPQNIKVGDVEIAGESAWEPARIELWKWILIGGLCLLIFEWWIFNRRVYL